uniref:Uncharacterized protein n=1 Tax=Tetraselmis sp. GSL018 TaxID=582737 RepID=A0A061RWB4_9CHLO
MQARPTAWSERPDIRPMLEEFQTIYENRQRDAILKPERELPERFADATRWKYRTAKQEHPVYSTSNNTYGASAPAQQQMVKVYHGIDGSFTNGFNNNFKKPALNTSKTRSRVHGELDEF